jgi:hypothetical protein
VLLANQIAQFAKKMGQRDESLILIMIVWMHDTYVPSVRIMIMDARMHDTYVPSVEGWMDARYTLLTSHFTSCKRAHQQEE